MSYVPIFVLPGIFLYITFDTSTIFTYQISNLLIQNVN